MQDVHVSVPLRGTTFLNKYSPKSGRFKQKFPSPYGELHFSIKQYESKGMWIFVSVPLRGTTFLNRNGDSGGYPDADVSVPLRGTTFLNDWEKVEEKMEQIVSVPLRGTTFLNREDGADQRHGSRFRPLTGNYISQSAACPKKTCSGFLFPSPYGELHFSIIERGR